MPEMLFHAMNKEGNLPERANLIRLVGTKYASREDVPAKDRSLWDEAEPLKTLVQAAVRRWLNFGDEAILPHAVRVVVGFEAMNQQDRKLIHLFKQYHRAYLMGHSKAIKEIRGLIQKCGPLDIPVLITGETGTGKEIVARLIHEASKRAEGLFAAVNCANLEGTLLQDRLFGHVKGAYSGADRDRQGLFEQANGGTLFLDEIGEMPLETQAQLLRVLQDGEFYRLGEEKARATDVRIVAATNRDLMAEVAQGKFREDLYYRLAVIPIALPPLRERSMDIPTLAGHVLHQFCRDQGLPKLELTPRQLDTLKRHHWPGNVRELENVLQRMVALGEKNVAKLILPGSPSRQGPAKIVPLKEFEQQYVREVYDRLERNIARTAQALGISRNNLKGKLK
jgi:two-component system NtrC family response regulator